MTNKDTEPDPSELAERIERLEEQNARLQTTVLEMLPEPSRRDALKVLAGGAAGAGLMWAGTGSAAAGTGQAGTVGNQTEFFDWYIEDLFDKNDNNVLEAPGDGSVIIGAPTISGLSAGSTLVHLSALDANNNGSEIRTQTTDDVGTTATKILDGSQETGGAMIIVYGHLVGDTTVRFSDIVHFHRGAPPQVVNSIDDGTPASRSYTRDEQDLDLAMGLDTYDVTASALYIRE